MNRARVGKLCHYSLKYQLVNTHKNILGNASREFHLVTKKYRQSLPVSQLVTQKPRNISPVSELVTSEHFRLCLSLPRTNMSIPRESQLVTKKHRELTAQKATVFDVVATYSPKYISLLHTKLLNPSIPKAKYVGVMLMKIAILVKENASHLLIF